MATRNMRQQEYHPRTFEQRGAIAPFTTRMLLQGRVRPGRKREGVDVIDRLEVLLPGFSGGSSVYITPMPQLPELVSMTVHDRVLAEQIGMEQATSPTAIRKIWLDIAKTGVGGAAVTRRAAFWTRSVEATFRADRIMILQALARAEGLYMPDELARELMARGSDSVFRSAINAFAVAGKLDGSSVDTRLNGISRILAGIGLKGSPHPGRLRGQVSRLSELVQMLTVWGSETPSERGPIAIQCAQAAQTAHDLSLSELEQIDAETAMAARLVANWPKGGRALHAHVERLHWLMDGWEHLIDLWDSVVARNALAEDVVPEMARLLPVIPPDELEPGKPNIGSDERQDMGDA